MIWFTDTESTTIGVIDPGAADSGSDDAYWEACAPNWRNRKNSAVIGMGKTIGTVYVAWPLYDLYVLVRAFERRDVETVRMMNISSSLSPGQHDHVVIAKKSASPVSALNP